jgi:hypothetical protein
VFSTTWQQTAMSEEDVWLAVLTQPFEPLRIHLSNGATFGVKSPGAINIGRRSSGVVVGAGVQAIANMHITHVEPIATHYPERCAIDFAEPSDRPMSSVSNCLISPPFQRTTLSGYQ